MMNTYREDMAKALEVLARRQGLFTSYEDISESGREKRSNKQNLARKKELPLMILRGPLIQRRNFYQVHVYCISL